MSTPDDLHFDPDDPRLTAYALGELPDAADRAHVEALLAASPEARAELADIRSLTATLTAEYEQDRLTTDTMTTPTPANIVRLPDQNRAWRRPLLAVAAVLLLAGLVFSMLPVFNSVQVRGHRARSAVFAAPSELPPQAPGAFESALDNGTDISIGGAPPSSSADSSGPLLAQAQLPKLGMKDGRALGDAEGKTAPAQAAPYSGNITLNRATSITLDQNRTNLFGSTDHQMSDAARDKDNKSDVVDQRYASAAATSAPEVFTGSVPQPSGPSKTKVIQKSSASSRKVVTAERVTVTGSNIPTSEEVGVAPVDTVDQAARDRTGQEDVLSVLTRSTPAIASGGGSIGSSTSTMSGSLALRGSAHGMDDADGTLKDELAAPGRRPAPPNSNTAAYDHIAENPFLTAKENPLSTFSVDVDTASYSIVRRIIEQGSLPPADAVRIEEMLNYFPYDYAPPAPGDDHPFAVHLEGAACPWNPDHRLVRVALKGREIARDKRPPSNLVFLLDVSGSMEPPERLPLIKESLRLLVETLTDNDRVAIVVYAGNSGLVLPSTNGAHKDTILNALGRLEAGGSTNGASGIKLAYKVAQENFLKGGTNRVILATDGDFNVGTTSQGELVRLIEKEAKGGVFLSVLGVGTDNLKDSTMQKLADHGNGNYAYLDGIAEGKKVLVEQMSGTLVTIAKDVKIQVEFNPTAVNSYRLVGYEKRLLRKEDFNDDRVDAGEIGAGHSVTALYEIIPLGRHDAGAAPVVDALKYGPVPEDRPVRAVAKPGPVDPSELLTVKIRHKAPDSDTSERSYEVAFADHGTANDYANASPDFKFAAAVATFGLALRDSPYKGNATLGAAIELAQESKGTDASGYRAGFIELARRASKIR